MGEAFYSFVDLNGWSIAIMLLNTAVFCVIAFALVRLALRAGKKK